MPKQFLLVPPSAKIEEETETRITTQSGNVYELDEDTAILCWATDMQRSLIEEAMESIGFSFRGTACHELTRRKVSYVESGHTYMVGVMHYVMLFTRSPPRQFITSSKYSKLLFYDELDEGFAPASCSDVRDETNASHLNGTGTFYYDHPENGVLIDAPSEPFVLSLLKVDPDSDTIIKLV